MPGLATVALGSAAALPGGASLDVRLANRAFGGDPCLFHRSTGRFGLALYSLGKDWLFTVKTGSAFRVDQSGRTADCHLDNNGWTETTAEAFVRRILPRIVQLHGRMVIHGAALDTGAGVVLFCGGSGAGKSTLTASLSRQLGWRIMSDDMTVLEERAGDYLVSSTGNSVSLWEDSRAALSGAFESSERIEVYDSKFRCRINRHGPLVNQPLRAIFHLMPSLDAMDESVTIREIEPARHVALLARQVISFNPGDRRAEAERFSTLAKMAGSVPFNALCYPRRFDALPKIAGRLSGMFDKVCAPAISQ